MNTDLKSLETHYGFGANWRNYLKHIDKSAITQAKQDFQKLVGLENVDQKTMIDVGCGSGLHSLAGVQSNAKKVVAIDIDPNSVAATSETLKQLAPNSDFEVHELSIFDDKISNLGKFDLVYSWGVLHHTGAMWDAIAAASNLTKPGGVFVLAIYRRTPFCPLWKIEKRIYSDANALTRKLIRSVYTAALKLRLWMRGNKVSQYISEYSSSRGMNFYIDVEDWLGGYPYESATEKEVANFVEELGFVLDYQTSPNSGLGLLGTGCAEFRFKKLDH